MFSMSPAAQLAWTVVRLRDQIANPSDDGWPLDGVLLEIPLLDMEFVIAGETVGR